MVFYWLLSFQGTSHFDEVFPLRNPKAGAHREPVQASGTQVVCRLKFKNKTKQKEKIYTSKQHIQYPENTNIHSDLFLFRPFRTSGFRQNSASGLSHRNAHGLGQAPCVSNISPGSWRDFQNPRLAEGLLHMACFRRSRQHKDLVQ